ncbi:MAG TPA: hypothetical protein VG844_09280 [Terracidiphilus sp.]|nr:hypothetical protein [Terracidiphilus sp.]
MQHLMHWLTDSATVIAIVVTVGVGVLLFCCLGCSKCGGCEKDDLFRKRHV